MTNGVILHTVIVLTIPEYWTCSVIGTALLRLFCPQSSEPYGMGGGSYHTQKKLVERVVGSLFVVICSCLLCCCCAHCVDGGSPMQH